MKIYMDQIPEDVAMDEYPAGTEFVFDEPVRQRDPVTHKLMPRERRPLIYPADVKN
jgi:hypothetical protein